MHLPATLPPPVGSKNSEARGKYFFNSIKKMFSCSWYIFVTIETTRVLDRANGQKCKLHMQKHASKTTKTKTQKQKAEKIA